MKKYLLVPMLIISLSGCGSQEIDMVKGGRLPNCEAGTMAQITDGFMKSPTWESGKTSDGREFVNVTGEISYMEKPVKATIQFVLDKSKTSFQFGALEFNGVPQAQLIAGVLLTKMCETKAPSGQQTTSSSDQAFLSSMSAKWNVGSFSYTNGKLVGIGNGNAFIITSNGKFDADNQMLPVKVKLFNDLDFRPLAPFMSSACSELAKANCAPRTESELMQLEKQFVETANKYKFGQDVDGGFLLYNASKEPNTFRLGLKNEDGKIVFEGGFISKLNDTDISSLANFATNGNIPERSKIIDEFVNSTITEKRAQFAEDSATPFFKLAGDVSMLEQAYAAYFEKSGDGNLNSVDDWNSLGLKSAPAATKEISSISISKAGTITATVAPGFIGETSCGTITFEPSISLAKTVNWYARTTCPEPAIAFVDKLNY